MDVIFEADAPLRLKREYIVEFAPRLNNGNLEPDEKTIAFSIEDNLNDILKAGRSALEAIALFQFCTSQTSRGHDLFSQWRYVAGREGAMSLRNYATALATVRGLIGRVSDWRTQVDTKALKSAEKDFNRQFPFAHKMRHSVAHPEIYSDPEQDMGVNGTLNAFGVKIEGNGKLVMQNSIHGEEFGATFEGTLVSYALSTASAVFVRKSMAYIFAAFAEIDRLKGIEGAAY